MKSSTSVTCFHENRETFARFKTPYDDLTPPNIKRATSYFTLKRNSFVKSILSQICYFARGC